MFQYLSPFKEKRGLICGPLILSAGSASEGGGGEEKGTRMNSHVAYQKLFFSRKLIKL